MKRGNTSVYRLSNPENENRKWRAKLKLSFPDGSTREVARHGRTKGAAIEALEFAVNKILAVYVRSSQQTIDDVFDRLMLDKQLTKNLKAKSIHNNKRDYAKHIKPFIGSQSITMVSYEQLENILHTILQRGHYRTADLVTTI